MGRAGASHSPPAPQTVAQVPTAGGARARGAPHVLRSGAMSGPTEQQAAGEAEEGGAAAATAVADELPGPPRVSEELHPV